MDSTPIQQLYNAVDISGVSTSTVTLMTGFIAIAVLFFGYRVVRKTLRMGA